MSVETAKKTVDWIFCNVPSYADKVEIDFFGGEPLLEFDLIKEIVEYTRNKECNINYSFSALTNGTLLDTEMKAWFAEHSKDFALGLSLDGDKETHNFNRCNSFKMIDFDFFLKTWSMPPIKMTLSEFSLPRLAKNIKFIHSLGFRDLRGVNLYDGSVNWSARNQYIDILISQLYELADYYVDNLHLPLDNMLGKDLLLCENQSIKRKGCSVGNGTVFFDVDGKQQLCHFITSMTFDQDDLDRINETNFLDEDNFVDQDCIQNCYLYPICPTCAGVNYLKNKTFKQRDKSQCRIQKIVALFSADILAKRIVQRPEAYDSNTRYFLIEAIKRIRELYIMELTT